MGKKRFVVVVNPCSGRRQGAAVLDELRPVFAAVEADLARVTMGSSVTHCVNIVGWGAAHDINRTAERLKQ